MDPPRRAGLGLKTQTRPSRMTEASLSTAPASPTERVDETIPSKDKAPHTETSQTVTTSSSAPPYSILGHLSFAPATQQTIVTTTTTTTVSLPPLLFKPPRHLSTRDPKQYPLALAPTPNSLKNFCIQVGDKPVVYKESDDAQTSLNKVSLNEFEYTKQQLSTSGSSIDNKHIYKSRTAPSDMREATLQSTLQHLRARMFVLQHRSVQHRLRVSQKLLR